MPDLFLAGSGDLGPADSGFDLILTAPYAPTPPPLHK